MAGAQKGPGSDAQTLINDLLPALTVSLTRSLTGHLTDYLTPRLSDTIVARVRTPLETFLRSALGTAVGRSVSKALSTSVPDALDALLPRYEADRSTHARTADGLGGQILHALSQSLCWQCERHEDMAARDFILRSALVSPAALTHPPPAPRCSPSRVSTVRAGIFCGRCAPPSRTR